MRLSWRILQRQAFAADGIPLAMTNNLAGPRYGMPAGTSKWVETGRGTGITAYGAMPVSLGHRRRFQLRCSRSAPADSW